MNELPKYAVLSANKRVCIIPVTDPRRAYFDNSAGKLISFQDLKVSNIRYILSVRHGINISPKLFGDLSPMDALTFLMLTEGFSNDEILDYLAFEGYMPGKSNGSGYLSQLVKELKTILTSSNYDYDLDAYLKRVKQAHLYAHLINLLWLTPGNTTIRKYSSYLVKQYFKSDDVKLIVNIFKGVPPKDKGVIENIIKILYLLHNGVELNNVAERFRISPSTVSSLLKRAIRADLLRAYLLQ